MVCRKMNFVFALLIAIVIFSSASNGGSTYIQCDECEKYDIIKVFFTWEF